MALESAFWSKYNVGGEIAAGCEDTSSYLYMQVDHVSMTESQEVHGRVECAGLTWPRWEPLVQRRLPDGAVAGAIASSAGLSPASNRPVGLRMLSVGTMV